MSIKITRNGILKLVTTMVVVALVGCAGKMNCFDRCTDCVEKRAYTKVIKMSKVASIPDDSYERIIKLNTPSTPDNRTLAGIVFIKKGASVCADFPRTEMIKSFADLQSTEKGWYLRFTKYAIKIGDETLGFVALSAEYDAILWVNKKNETCRYKVQVVPPENMIDDTSEGG
ncbi:MAG: hypothetical protein K4571_16590 [Deltaproteobacteria bacterium]